MTSRSLWSGSCKSRIVFSPSYILVLSFNCVRIIALSFTLFLYALCPQFV